MADGRLVPSLGTWKGQVTVKGVNHHGTFEVLNSNSAWALLFGKLLLEAFHVVHDYSNDVIRLPKGNGWVTLGNQFANTGDVAGDLLANLTINIKQLINTLGDKILSPSREVSHIKSHVNQVVDRLTDVAERSKTSQLEEVSKTIDLEQKNPDVNKPVDKWCLLWLLDLVAGDNPTHPGIEQPDVTKTFKPTLLTRKTNPHNLAHVEAILAEITLGKDLTSTQCEAIHAMISEYAECFTLSTSKVMPVEGASLRPDIP